MGKSLIGFCFLLANGNAHPQNNVGVGTSRPDASAMLLPRMSQQQRDASCPLSSGYTYTIRRGTNTGGGFSYSELSANPATLTSATVQTIGVTGLTQPEGETIALKVIGTVAYNAVGQQKTIYRTLIAK